MAAGMGMSKFSPSEAALEGFRLTRERPGLIATWAGLYFLGIIAMGLVMVASLGPDFVAFIRQDGLQMKDTAEFGDLLAQSWPAFIVVLAMALLLLAVLTAGIYRVILRPLDKKTAYLRVGADEVRLAVVHFILMVIGVAFFIAVDLAVAAAATQGGPIYPILALVLAGGMIWVGVRLSLATPLAFYQKKISLGAAWNLTRGCFWPLFGMIVLAVIFYVMIFLLISMILAAVVGFAGGATAVQDMSRLTPITIAALAATVIVQMIMPILQAVTLYAPFAVAYGELSGIRPVPAPKP
jgi:hypothetical protein